MNDDTYKATYIIGVLCSKQSLINRSTALDSC